MLMEEIKERRILPTHKNYFRDKFMQALPVCLASAQSSMKVNFFNAFDDDNL